jgi:uncharacterized membrane protein YcaP (DUF421 family)
MFSFAVSPAELALRSVVIYLGMLVALRVFGKREVGQFTLFDLVLVLLIANAVQPAMTGPDSSLGGGLVIIGVLVAANRLLAMARTHLPFARAFLGSAPALIAENGQWIDRQIKREGLDIDDCEMALREHGLKSVADVDEAVLEPDGNISVVPKRSGDRAAQSRRRVRYVRRH